MAESEKFDWSQLEEAKKDLVKRAEALKQSFVQMPGGAPAGDPAAGGAPADPAAGGAPVDPAMAGGMPPAGDPAAGGAPVDPAMAGMDPAMLAAMAGGAPMGVDPATAGMLGAPAAAPAPDAGAGAGAGGATEPTITITIGQLIDLIKKLAGVSKMLGPGVAPEAAAPAQAAAPGSADIKAAVVEALGDMGLTR